MEPATTVDSKYEIDSVNDSTLHSEGSSDSEQNQAVNISVQNTIDRHISLSIFSKCNK